MDIDRLKVRSLLTTLSFFCWSKEPPSAHVFTKEGKSVGLGHLKDVDYAAYNLAWYANKPITPDEDCHVKFIRLYTEAKHVLPKDLEVHSRLTLMRPQEFVGWYSLQEGIQEPVKSLLSKVFDARSRLQKIL